MARGTQSKTLIANSLLQIFPGSFIDSDGKTVRIPTTCEGKPIEVKIQMTAAKDIVGGAPAIPITEGKVEPQNREMTEKEIQTVKSIIERLHL